MKKKRRKPQDIAEILAQGQKATPEDVVEFLESFRELQAGVQRGKSRLISLKVPEPLLTAFKLKAAREKTPYQSQIKRLMMAWVQASED